MPKQEKHGSGNDSDYDNTQSYDVSLRSDTLPHTVATLTLHRNNGTILR